MDSSVGCYVLKYWLLCTQASVAMDSSTGCYALQYWLLWTQVLVSTYIECVIGVIRKDFDVAVLILVALLSLGVILI